ncbi:hypothetical protein A3D01_02335 [Candidatus Woesebacteria bacterium RIFCSPHIGHO2_02_FULL_39_13]|uniref:Uncharacterized protein n=1 Tax=Candidatus Woesebacteria bacterium RIFCSPHIGHO2_02_FULL_39_13 TaxID=1802505 RepID=A0A1F7Z4X1_9BACT|nr:MAG: hypothetical protein A3D01_02335 [Candidatus Woesebacteria bacterium RIFCSPHIGHO2_02_FULL_39_13]OGM37578.1 MAG: hypothetical protein A3E13_01350 [Candidatus Woesebacteria bacterium RIFCSPHIGHO2_12_FULL_40_20]OGM72528.1 MAG: hypothetical protein A3H19_01125 [Candidatus Woesebacteria bacterium RIFCSPLOWO2_12_FULL_39_9]
MEIKLVDPQKRPSFQQLMMLVALGQARWNQEVLVGDDGTLITYFAMAEQELWMLAIEMEPGFLVSAGTLEGQLLIDRASLGEFAHALKGRLEHLKSVRAMLEARKAENLPLV